MTDTLSRLFATIEARAGADPAVSHTAALLARGPAGCAEKYGEEAVEAINAARAAGGRAIPVGTTALRLLESAVRETGKLRPWRGDTDIFIAPGFRFAAADGLMTNFHLPRSTLLMLVSALMGRDSIRRIYAHAIAERYRFYSYGDSSLLLPE